VGSTDRRRTRSRCGAPLTFDKLDGICEEIDKNLCYARRVEVDVVDMEVVQRSIGLDAVADAAALQLGLEDVHNRVDELSGLDCYRSDRQQHRIEAAQRENVVNNALLVVGALHDDVGRGNIIVESIETRGGDVGQLSLAFLHGSVDGIGAVDNSAEGVAHLVRDNVDEGFLLALGFTGLSSEAGLKALGPFEA
jgi:hypothetical protein